MSTKKQTNSTIWYVGDRIEGRYEVQDIKKGGMGVVYLCYDHEFKSPVAVKTLQDQYLSNESLVDRFMWEAETWVRLEKHTNIVQAYYVYKIKGIPYIFIEYIAGNEKFGGDLKGWIKKGGLDMMNVLKLAIQFCNGMAYAQSKFDLMNKPFVYRDIKPANIMITKDKKVKITDFGLVKVFLDREKVSNENGDESGLLHRNPELSNPNSIMGTPAYMAPEQWLTKDIDIRADIYGFGCVLYEMLTGKPPFIENSLMELRKLHFKKEPEPINFIPKELYAVVAKCLAKDKEKRYQDFLIIKKRLASIYSKMTGKEVSEELGGTELELWEIINKGVSMYNLGYYKEAIACYDKALTLKSDYADAYHNRGIAYRTLKKYQDALNDYNNAIKYAPANAEAHYNRGIIYQTMKKFEQALEDYDKAIKLKPSYAEAYYNRGIVNRSLGRIEESLKNYNEAIKLKGDYAKAYYNRGNVYYEQGLLDKAIQDHYEAVKLNPKYCSAYYNLALALEDAGRDSEAISIWKKYLKSSKNIPSQEEWIEKAMVHLQNLKNK